MYAILEVDGKQYKVAPDDVIDVNRLDAEPKSTLMLDKVLLFSDGTTVNVGRPYLTNVKVEAEVLAEKKGKKVIVYKFLRRKDFHKKIGHRQLLTSLRIKTIAV